MRAQADLCTVQMRTLMDNIRKLEGVAEPLRESMLDMLANAHHVMRSTADTAVCMVRPGPTPLRDLDRTVRFLADDLNSMCEERASLEERIDRTRKAFGDQLEALDKRLGRPRDLIGRDARMSHTATIGDFEACVDGVAFDVLVHPDAEPIVAAFCPRRVFLDATQIGPGEPGWLRAGVKSVLRTFVNALEAEGESKRNLLRRIENL